MNRKRRKRRGQSSKGMLGIIMIVLVFLVVMTVQSQELKAKNTAYAAREAELQSQIESEEARTEEIAQLAEYMQTDEYIEEVAKDKLGLVYEDEIIFKPEQK